MSDAILLNSMKTIIRRISKSSKKKYTAEDLGGILQKRVFDLITK